MINYFLFAISGAFSLAMLVGVVLKPFRFWRLLAATSVCTGGVVVSSLGIIDEIIVGGIIAGYLIFLAFSRFPVFNCHREAIDELHLFFFILMIAYMTTQSVYAVFGLDDLSLRKIRWVLYFMMLGILAFVLPRKKTLAPTAEKLAPVIAAAGFVYFFVYLGAGMLFEFISGKPKWDMQNVFWGGTTYAAFPIIAVLPAVFLLFQSRIRPWRVLGLLTFFVMSIAAFYYDSRISYIAIIGFLILVLMLLGVRRFAAPLSLFLAVASVFICIFWSSFYSFEVYGRVLYESAGFLWNSPQAHDTGRLAHLAIGPMLVKSGLKTALFGHGFRTSGDLIGPALAQFYENQGKRELAFQSSRYGSTVGLTALLVETGIVGVALLAINFIFTAAKIIASNAGRIKIVLLYCLALAFMWLLITDPVDIVLFYLLIMPSGLLYRYLDNRGNIDRPTSVEKI